jgi:competence protein ComEA
VPERHAGFKAGQRMTRGEFLQGFRVMSGDRQAFAAAKLNSAIRQNTAWSARPSLTPLTKGNTAMKPFLTALVTLLLAAAAWAADPVNINSASAEEISQSLKGVGLSKAQAIVAYREANGSFLHADELVNVKGIGIRTVDQNRGLIQLDDAEATADD